MNVKFDLGEEKNVIVTIRSCKEDSFIIESAKWELFYKTNEFKSVPTDSDLENDGVCVIQEEHKLYSLIKPQREGNYILRLTYVIANETLIENIPLEVRKWGR